MEYHDKNVREDLGYVDSDPETNRRIRKFFDKQRPKKSGLEEAVKVGLRRFPELERGETIYAKEIKRKLREIKRTGYPLRPYSHLNKEQAWEYLNEIRSKLYKQAEINCPEILNEVKMANLNSLRKF